MPQVGKQHFPYTKQGFKKALKQSRETGEALKLNKSKISYQRGGMLRGPSHSQGGIQAKTGNQPIEMEGGEYVINKNSAKKLAPNILNYMNKNGAIPRRMQQGGPVKKQMPMKPQGNMPPNMQQGKPMGNNKLSSLNGQQPQTPMGNGANAWNNINKPINNINMGQAPKTPSLFSKVEANRQSGDNMFTAYKKVLKSINRNT